ncbi:MAG: hypothetical protein OXC68_14735 [Aestuariivita sp.]|nr:hypothetical protein [Aestuariivita sp.]
MNLSKILSKQADKMTRCEEWKIYAPRNIFGTKDELIPDYEGEIWNQKWENLDKQENSNVALKEDVWRFYQAASLHRAYVLRDLLPKYGLIAN